MLTTQQGHTIGHMMTGGSRGSDQEVAASQPQDNQAASQTYNGQQG